MDEPTLTPEQIDNWRNALVTILGPYALLMSDEDVVRARNSMQSSLNKYDTEL